MIETMTMNNGEIIAVDVVKQLPDLSRPLQIMDLCFRIETKIAGVDNMIADSVRLAMHNGTPYIKVVEMLKSMAEDNRKAIEYMIGIELTKKLEDI